MQLFCLSTKYTSHIHKDKSSCQSVVQSSHCCSTKKRMKISASSQFMNERVSNWMKKREKKRKKPKLVPELPGHFRTLRSYRPPRLGREREREMWERWHTDSHRHRNSRGAATRCGDGELGWALTLSALQKLSYSFLTSNLLTYLPTKSLHRHLGAMAVPRASAHLHRHRPHLRAFAQGILTSAARSRDHEEG
jgi:hypothetical protein